MGFSVMTMNRKYDIDSFSDVIRLKRDLELNRIEGKTNRIAETIESIFTKRKKGS